MYCLLFQLLKHVTIASGGVIPRIHPELLVRKKGGKVVLPTPKPKPPVATKPAAKKAKVAAPPTPPAAPAAKGKAAGKKTAKGKAGAVRIYIYLIYIPLQIFLLI